MLGVVVGALSFRLLDERIVAGIVGVSTLAFLAQRLLFPPRPDSPHPPKWVGGILTALSGFTSFVAHAGGPPINAYVILLRPRRWRSRRRCSELFFVINLSKWIP